MKVNLVDCIYQTVRKNDLLQQNSKVIVAVSGGIDSTALLHILAELDLPLQLYAVYIDHGLRPDETEAEIEHVKREAEKLGVTFISQAIDTVGYQKLHKSSQEEAARILRYQALETLRNEYNADYICVGHTSDDQVEEFFLRSLRGSGLAGLSGMLLKHNNIIRPLLHTRKQELEEYLAKKRTSHCEDSSNQKRIYTRNKVRLDLLPLLETLNPSIRQTVHNTCQILQAEDDFLSTICKEQYKICVMEEDKALILNLDLFSKLHIAIQRRVLELLLWQVDTKPTYAIINNALSFSSSSERGKTLTLEKGLRITKEECTLKFHHPFGKNASTRAKEPSFEELDLLIDNLGVFDINELEYSLNLYKFPYAKNLNLQENQLAVDLDKIKMPLVLRYQTEGERFTPVNGNGSKKINRYLSEKKIRADLRRFHPILATESGDPIAILGLNIAEQFKVDDTTKYILIIEWQPTES